MKAHERANNNNKKKEQRSNPGRRTVTVDLLPSCRWRCSSVWLNHVCFMFLLPCRPPRSLQPFLRHLFSLASSNRPLTNAFFLPSRPANVFYSILFFLLVSDGSSDSGPPVSPPRARKGEYPSRLHYEAHNVITDPTDVCAMRDL